MKAGRNDPCPCGSGKKFKKCCLEKVELEAQAQCLEQLSKQSEYLQQKKSLLEEDNNRDKKGDANKKSEENKELSSDLLKDSSTDSFSGENYSPSEYNDYLSLSKNIEFDDPQSIFWDEPLPEISEAENELVVKWLAATGRMKNTAKEREHLIRFMDAHPQLVDHLALNRTFFIALGNWHFRKNIYNKYVELLLRFRKEFPYTYKKCYETLDSNLIYWFVAQGRIDEIGPFFDWYKQDKKLTLIVNFDSVTSFFKAINHSDVLLTELSDCENLEKFILTSRINHIFQKYFDMSVSTETAGLLLKELEANGINVEQSGDITALYGRLQNVKRPFTKWDDTVPEQQNMEDLCLTVTENFAYYLYEKFELTFDSAEYYAKSVYQFFIRAYLQSKKQKIIRLNKQLFEKHSLFTKRDWLSINLDYITEFNAIYYFVSYLRTCGNLTEEQKQEFHDYLIEKYTGYYEKAKNEGPVMLMFKKFPLWGTIQEENDYMYVRLVDNA